MALSCPWGSYPENIAAFPDELARREIINLVLFDRRVVAEVEVLQSFGISESRHGDSSIDQAIIAKEDLILEQQFQELAMTQA
jgi:hypothetical protein